MNNIFVFGDTHGLLDAEKIKNIVEDKKLDYSDYVIICGDSGIVWSEQLTKEHIQFYDRLKTNILYIDGNHDNHKELNKYKVEMWHGGKVHKISENIFHLLRGQVFNILDKTFFTMGGADSTDKERRIKGISWWEEECITVSDILEGLNNLKKCSNKVDYVLTHTPPSKMIKLIKEQYSLAYEQIPLSLEKKLKNTDSTELLKEIEHKIQFSKWFCGHLHYDFSFDNKYYCLYENYVKI